MKRIFLMGLFAFFISSLMMGDLTFQYTKDALIIWFEKLVPSLFISMVLVRILYEQNFFYILLAPFKRISRFLFHLDLPSSCLVLESMLLGFPTGALLIDEQVKKGHIAQKDARRLLYTCSFATPGFIIMSCGVVVFQSIKIGWYMLLIQLVSALIFLLVTRRQSISCTVDIMKTPPFMHSLSSAIVTSGITLYKIGGYLILFMTLCSLLLIALPNDIGLPIKIFAEFSSGVMLISEQLWSVKTKIILISSLLGFGGFCVHMQVCSMVENANMKYATYLIWRVMQAILCGFIAYLFF